METKLNENWVIKFVHYLVKTYIGEDAIFPPDVWNSASVDTYLTINGHCESFHAYFNLSFNSTHPNIFSVITKLKEVQTETPLK